MPRGEKLQIARRWLRVPVYEWPAIKYGQKREFRSTFRVLSLVACEKPTPVIGYRSGGGDYDQRIMVLENSWSEPLGAISPESLAAEECDTLKEFKTRWAVNHTGRFSPLQTVYVYQVRPWGDSDQEHWEKHIFNKLYPEEVRGL